LKRDEAILILKELLEKCQGLDNHNLEITNPTSGYQIIIRGILDAETKQHIENIAAQHQLLTQTGNIWKTKHSINKTEPDTIIIYRKKP
jgi:hypothetical protein